MSASCKGRDLFRDLDISVRDLAAKVVARQPEGHLAIGDTNVWMVIHGFGNTRRLFTKLSDATKS
jgi:hypothetical protein